MGKRVPDELKEDHREEEIGARHGEATGVWRIMRNGVIAAAVLLLILGLIFV